MSVAQTKKTEETSLMNRITRFVIWICSKFNRVEIEQIINGLQVVLADRDPEIKPKDDFKEKHPNYRDFYVDPLAPLTEHPPQKTEPQPVDWLTLLKNYEQKQGKTLKPISRRKNLSVPKQYRCEHCRAPAHYLYYNDGKKRSQLRCKICSHLFQVQKRYRQALKAKYFCPYCGYALYRWKEQETATIFKCGNDHCPAYLKAKNKLNDSEKKLQNKKNSQFKLRYQYREYHFHASDLKHSSPDKPKLNLARIHNSSNVLGLVLALHISCGLAARKTAFMLRHIFNVNLSYQTVLNYAEAAAHHCHRFNLAMKGPVDHLSAGDEAYIKIQGKYGYVFFFVCTKRLKITAYHVADNRDVLPATTVMLEAIRTVKHAPQHTFVTDGNPAYAAGIHFINAHSASWPHLRHQKVIGLQNLDTESALFRPYKQIIERLNRTFKSHVRPAHGFNTKNGAVALTTLFVTYYNFLRPHMSLNYRVPVSLPELKSITTLQGKWMKILSMAIPAFG